MNIQHERIAELCEKIGLPTIAVEYAGLCQEASKKQDSYANLLEDLLLVEWKQRQCRSRQMLTRMAGFPTIKTLDEFECSCQDCSCGKC